MKMTQTLQGVECGDSHLTEKLTANTKTIQAYVYTNEHSVINPRCACAARVTVVDFVRPSVCLSVCKKFVVFFLKPLCCRDPALPALYGYP